MVALAPADVWMEPLDTCSVCSSQVALDVPASLGPSRLRTQCVVGSASWDSISAAFPGPQRWVQPAPAPQELGALQLFPALEGSS